MSMNNRVTRQRVTPTAVNKATASGHRPNSVNLSGADLERLLAELDRPPGQSETPAAKKRGFVRWQYRPLGVQMRVEQSGGGGISSDATVTVACRNLSRGGASILHGSYIHPGSAVTVFLRSQDHGLTAVPGSIVRCRHVRGMVHEIGVKFSFEIDTKDFMPRDPLSDSFSLEHVEPSTLQGCVVLVEDNDLDARMIQHFLRETHVRLKRATSKAEAMPLVGEGCDLVLCDYNLGSETLLDVVGEMRAQGIQTPVVVITADTGSVARERLIELQAAALLSKPVSQSLLLRAVAEFLLVGANGQAVRSTLGKGDPNEVLVEPFVAQARQFAKRLGDALTREDVQAAKSICMQIRGTASMLGFVPLGKLADAAANAIGATSSVKESVVALRSLIAACDRIHV